MLEANKYPSSEGNCRKCGACLGISGHCFACAMEEMRAPTIVIGGGRRFQRDMIARDTIKARLSVAGMSDEQIFQLESQLFEYATHTLHPNNHYVNTGLDQCYSLLCNGYDVKTAIDETLRNYRA